MKKLLFIILIATNILLAQSNWQVYKTPYNDSLKIYTFSDNTGTPPFLGWWKTNIGIDYSNLPSVISTGITYAMSAWGNEYFDLSFGYDVDVVLVTGVSQAFFGKAPLTVNNETGEIISGKILVNFSSTYPYNGTDYTLIWNTNGDSRIDDPNHRIYVDSRAEMAHELGHLFGIYHVKNVSNAQTMSTFQDCWNNGFDPTNRMNIKTDDRAALDFLYNKPALSDVILSGTYLLYQEGTGHWAVELVDGRPPFSYSWQIMYVGDLLFSLSSGIIGDPGENALPSNTWVQIGLDSPYFSKEFNPYDTRDFKLRCTVTDKLNTTVTSNVWYVNVYDAPYPGTTSFNGRSDELKIKMENSNSEPKVDYGYSLLQNYPNPFNPTTLISYSIKEQSFVSLKVYDIIGREVGNLVNEFKPAGTYNVEFNGSDLPSGIYVYKLNVGNNQFIKKMILAK